MGSHGKSVGDLVCQYAVGPLADVDFEPHRWCLPTLITPSHKAFGKGRQELELVALGPAWSVNIAGPIIILCH